MSNYSFKDDPRISDWERERLRDFCASLEGDIAFLAKDFGLKVFEEDLLPYERGYLEKVPSLGSSSGWDIRVNRTDRIETKNFTVAHELGHFVLHKARLANLDTFDGRINRDTQGGVDPFSYLEAPDRIMEAEANRFAAALLMPLNLFKPAFQRLGGNIYSLAKLFLVAENAIIRRIAELRL